MISVSRQTRLYAPQLCPCCGESAAKVLCDDLECSDELVIQKCRECGHQVLHQCPALDYETDDEFEPVILDKYLSAMRAARTQAARRMLLSIVPLVEAKRSLLDVGASFGWLVEEARRDGWQADGIEPSKIACDDAERRGVQLMRGFFPRDLPRDGQRWQVITMMDVLEHLEAPLDILLEVRARLETNGIFAIQVPNSRGAFVAIARALARLGRGRRFCGPLERMYQTQFPYPHLQYFHATNLARLLARAGFEVLAIRATPTIAGRMADRIGYLKPRFKATPASSAVIVMSSWMISMAARLTGRHDTFYCIARPTRHDDVARAE